MKCVKCKTCGHESIVNEQDEFFRCSSCGSYNELNAIVAKSSIRCIRCNTPLDAKSIKDGVLECNHCHQIMTFPKDNQASNVKENIELGKSSLDICKFEQAYEYFTKAIELDPREPEGYFNRALARFNVQYLRDLVNRRMQPICHIVNDKKFSEDNDYTKALQYASDKQKKEYQRKAIEIDNIKKEFKKLEEKGITYDCFICVKVTDEYQNKTNDYQKAYDLYHNLKDEGINPFFSEASLKDCIGEAYEAHILYALYKAKCMLIVCSDESYLDTPWVKNEYTRYQSFIESKEKSEGSLCIVYNKNTIEHLPTIKNKLQGIDLSSMDSFITILKFVKKYSVKEDKSKSKILNKVNLLVLRNKQKEAIEILFDALDENYSDYDLWDKLFELYAKDKDYKDNVEALYQEAIEALDEIDRTKFKNKYSKYISNDTKAKDINDLIRETINKSQDKSKDTTNKSLDNNKSTIVKNDNNPNSNKDLFKKIFVSTLEKYKQKVLEGYVDISYPYDKRQEIIDFLKSNKDKNDNILYQYGCFILEGKISASNNFKDAFEIMNSLAIKNNAEAQYRLGICYYIGQGITQDYTKAVYWYTKAANQGHSNAQNSLAVCYENGQGVSQDYAQAFNLYKKAADQGNSDAQNNLGHCYYSGRGVDQDFKQAFKWFKKSANQGNKQAQYNLAICYDNGRGTTQDYKLAIKWYTKSADQGNSNAQFNLGSSYYRGQGTTQDYKLAVYWYKKSAEQGNRYAQNNLGYCYENGQGVAQDYSQAFNWYKKSAEQGNSNAQNSLGDCYYFGRGVEKDYTKAVYWYTKAAEQGDYEAQYNLGDCYYYGHGVINDYAKAFAWYTKSAEQGYSNAQEILGECYYYGKGVTQDYKQAFNWYKKAADQGNSAAQINLGIYYERGICIPQDYNLAYNWYKKAAEQGDSLAKYNLEKIKQLIEKSNSKS